MYSLNQDKHIISKEFKFETERSCRTFTTPIEPMMPAIDYDTADQVIDVPVKPNCAACEKPIDGEVCNE